MKNYWKSDPDLTILGFINMGDGLGRQSAELIDAFQKEMHVNFVPTRKQQPKNIPTRFHKLLKKKIKWGKVLLFEEMLWWPNQEKYRKILPSRKNCIRIAYSMWESTKIPQEWTTILNQHFDAVAVPSHFLIEVYQKSGVEIPIFELPLGLDLSKFIKQPLKKEAKKPFVFGNLSVCSERKNQISLVRAFARAFGNDPDFQLRINCRYGEKETSNAITKEIVSLNVNNIIFTQFGLNNEEYLELFKTIDCYVSIAKGEGFSIQPREAMALGIPVIATNNTGQEAICQSGLVEVIETPIQEIAVFPWGNSYGHYFNCTEEQIISAMRNVIVNYQRFIKNGLETRKWAAQYQYENLLDSYRCLIQPKKILLGEENSLTKECLITNSKRLYNKYLTQMIEPYFLRLVGPEPPCDDSFAK